MKIRLIRVFVVNLLALVTFAAYAATTDSTHQKSAMNAQASATKVSEQNQKEGNAYLEQNSKKEGVVTLPSGLQYKIIKVGTGRKPGANDTVTVDYEGTLPNGKVFDSSYQRGQPVTIPVGGVIPGWQEALQLMPAGSTWMLYIPGNLAYGEAGTSSTIGPNQALVFKVHLINVK